VKGPKRGGGRNKNLERSGGEDRCDLEERKRAERDKGG
jgi:hypothetical protein